MNITMNEVVKIKTVPGSRRLFELLASFKGTIDGEDFSVPKGFVTDFASVPHFVESIIANDDPDILRPSILHDWLCRYRGSPPGTSFRFSRTQVCRIFRDSMFFCGATKARAWVSWASVYLWSLHNWDILTVEMRNHGIKLAARRLKR